MSSLRVRNTASLEDALISMPVFAPVASSFAVTIREYSLFAGLAIDKSVPLEIVNNFSSGPVRVYVIESPASASVAVRVALNVCVALSQDGLAMDISAGAELFPASSIRSSMPVAKLLIAVSFPAAEETFTSPANLEAAERIFVVAPASKSSIFWISSFTAFRAPPVPRALTAPLALKSSAAVAVPGLASATLVAKSFATAVTTAVRSPASVKSILSVLLFVPMKVAIELKAVAEATSLSTF